MINLKPGDKVYDFDLHSVRWYRYLCVHPTNKSYHILIDGNEDPFRIYEPKLQVIIDKNLNSYEDAQLALAESYEERAKSLREK